MRTAKHPTSHPPESGNQLSCGLYVHLPYCETKCGYCDFYSVALQNRDTSPLVQRVIRELSARVDGSLRLAPGRVGWAPADCSDPSKISFTTADISTQLRR